MTNRPSAVIEMVGATWLPVVFELTRNSSPCGTPAAVYRRAKIPSESPVPPPCQVTTKLPTESVAIFGTHGNATPAVVLTLNSLPCGIPDESKRCAKMPWSVLVPSGPNHVTTKLPLEVMATLGSFWLPAVTVLTRNCPPCGSPAALYRWPKTSQLSGLGPDAQTTTKSPAASLATE